MVICENIMQSLQLNLHCILHNLFNDDDTFSRQYFSHDPSHQAHYAWMTKMFAHIQQLPILNYTILLSVSSDMFSTYSESFVMAVAIIFPSQLVKK